MLRLLGYQFELVRHSAQLGKRTGLHLVHQTAAMHLHGGLGNANIARNLFVEAAEPCVSKTGSIHIAATGLPLAALICAALLSQFRKEHAESRRLAFDAASSIAQTIDAQIASAEGLLEPAQRRALNKSQ
jgi:hypothetical protein